MVSRISSRKRGTKVHAVCNSHHFETDEVGDWRTLHKLCSALKRVVIQYIELILAKNALNNIAKSPRLCRSVSSPLTRSNSNFQADVIAEEFSTGFYIYMRVNGEAALVEQWY